MYTSPHHNPSPDPVFRKIDDLRRAMTRSNDEGDSFLNYLLEDEYSEGKGVWVNRKASARSFYDKLLKNNPYLASESPYGTNFKSDSVRKRGENQISIRNLCNAPPLHQAVIDAHRRKRNSGGQLPIALFAGGPAAKISALLCALPTMRKKIPLDVRFLLDGAEQSNESGSASYEHVNHANALNAELDNTGLGIFMSALTRAWRGEPNPDVALAVDYRKVDLWPRSITLKDIPIFLKNELHGRMQALRRVLGFTNDHTKSRLASKKSTEILSFLEQELRCSFRLENDEKRAVFLYFTMEHFRHSLQDNAELRNSVGLNPVALTMVALERLYGRKILECVVAADIFPENACIRHGFDEICRNEMIGLGVEYLHRRRIVDVYFETGPRGGASRVVGVTSQDLTNGEQTCLPVDYLGVSLGPTATYHFEEARTVPDRLRDWLGIASPVPYQTIATGMSAQVLFRIVDQDLARCLPFTGMKQTHFVEIGRTDSHVLMKLTCGGMIGIPVYSRSYGLSALASILRVLTTDTGLQFEDVICAWPCARGVNPSNNGQIVRLADNAVCRFGEGGTGMSKMGTNAQTMLDLLFLPWPAPQNLRMSDELFRHTVIDRRLPIAKRVARQI